MMRNILFVIQAGICLGMIGPELDEIFSDISDISAIFPHFTVDNRSDIVEPHDILSRNLTIDLENIDINEFKKSLDVFQEQMLHDTENRERLLKNLNAFQKQPQNKNAHNKMKLDAFRQEIVRDSNVKSQFKKNLEAFKNDLLKEAKNNDFRRKGVNVLDLNKTLEFKQANEIDLAEFQRFLNQIGSNETRRQVPFNGWNIFQWRRASYFYTKSRAIDAMLQLIYMARHKIRELENQKMFNTKDTSYRIAFLYRNLRRMWKKMMDIFAMLMKRAETQYYGPWDKLDPYLKLHHRAVKVYTDFTYFWWVMVRLHERYTNRSHIIMTKPPTHRPWRTTPLMNL